MKRKCTELGPPKGIGPGLRPVAIDGGDWTWKIMKEAESVVSGVGDLSLRLSKAQRRAFMLSWLPSTATTTRLRFPDSDISDRLDFGWFTTLCLSISTCFLLLTFLFLALAAATGIIISTNYFLNINGQTWFFICIITYSNSIVWEIQLQTYTFNPNCHVYFCKSCCFLLFICLSYIVIHIFFIFLYLSLSIYIIILCLLILFTL